MKVMTVRQPWAWAIVHGGKDVENRSRNIAGTYRGPVAIHAGLVYDEDALIWAGGRPLVIDEAGDHREPRGAIIGVVDLLGAHVCKSHPSVMDIPDCFYSGTPYARTCSAWAQFTPGQVTHHLVLANARSLVAPIPFKGALGMRDLPADIESLIRAGVVS